MLYVGLGILYLFLLVYFGVKCFKNSRWVYLVLGIFLPIFWIIGGMLSPKGMSKVDALYAQKEQH